MNAAGFGRLLVVALLYHDIDVHHILQSALSIGRPTYIRTPGICVPSTSPLLQLRVSCELPWTCSTLSPNGTDRTCSDDRLRGYSPVLI